MEKPTISSSKPLPDSTSPAPTSQPEKNADTPPNLTDDDLLVTWDSQTDPSCPFNWSLTRWWAITLLCSMGGMVTLMSASMLAPALGSISTDPLNHRKRSKYGRFNLRPSICLRPYGSRAPCQSLRPSLGLDPLVDLVYPVEYRLRLLPHAGSTPRWPDSEWDWCQR